MEVTPLATNNNFHFIRLIAALCVIYGHTAAITGKGPQDIFLTYVGVKFIGGVAVDVFFLISGFLITASAISSKGLIYYSFSRALRIFPALIVCVFITTFILGLALTLDPNYLYKKETWNYFLVNGFAIDTIYTLPGVFDQHPDKAMNGSLWSLPVEVKLYGLVFLLALTGIAKNRYLFNTVFFSCLTITYFKPESVDFILPYDNHLKAALMFYIGSFIYINKASINFNIMTFLFLFILMGMSINKDNVYYIYILFLPYMIFFFAFSPIKILAEIKNDYSYGIYLYGWPCQQIVFMVATEQSNLFQCLLSCVLAFLCAFLSWHIIEKNALKIKQPLAEKATLFINKLKAQHE